MVGAVFLASAMPCWAQMPAKGQLTYRSPRLTFSYPAAWGTATSVLVPECKLDSPSDKPDGVSPGHAAIFFKGGGLLRREDTRACRVPDFDRAQLRVFGAATWRTTDPLKGQSLAALTAWLSAGPGASDQAVPFVPFVDASPAFTEHVTRTDLAGGRGVGYLTQWMIEPDSIGRRLVYVFQAGSKDGQIYVLATFPLRTRLNLPEFPPVAGETYEATEARYRPYAAQVTEVIRAAKPGDFTPSLTEILAMCRSIDMR